MAMVLSVAILLMTDGLGVDLGFLDMSIIQLDVLNVLKIMCFLPI